MEDKDICSLAIDYNKHKNKIKFPVVVEPKLDGVRAIAYVDLRSKVVKYFFRSKDQIISSNMAPISKELLSMCAPIDRHALVFDGEVTSNVDFDATSGAIRGSGNPSVQLHYSIFDVIINGTLINRRQWIEGLFLQYPYARRHVFMVPQDNCDDHETLDKLYEKHLASGYEGVMIKDPEAPYTIGISLNTLKRKPMHTEDVKVIDAVVGVGKYENKLGALIVDVKGERVSVGTGFTDSQRDTIWDDHLLGKLTGRVVEVAYQSVTKNGKLRFPRFLRFRDRVENPGVKI